MDKVATFVRRMDRFKGDARLYRVDPPMAGSDHVIVSAVSVCYSGPETYIFPATVDGEVTDWGELDGSFRGRLDHVLALNGAGYRVVEDMALAAVRP